MTFDGGRPGTPPKKFLPAFCAPGVNLAAPSGGAAVDRAGALLVADDVGKGGGRGRPPTTK